MDARAVESVAGGAADAQAAIHKAFSCSILVGIRTVGGDGPYRVQG